MEIKTITTTDEFDTLTEAWRTLAVYQFGPLVDMEENDAVVTVGLVDGTPVAYLIADGRDMWHIETRSGFSGHGYARQLAEAANIRFAWEVCTDEGAAFCDAIGIDFEDCRD